MIRLHKTPSSLLLQVRLQTNASYTGPLQCLRSILKHEGVRLGPVLRFPMFLLRLPPRL